MKVKQDIDHKETLHVTITLQELEKIVRDQMLYKLDNFRLDSLWGDSNSIPIGEDITLQFVNSYQQGGVDIV